ncbi:MAG: arsenic transporter [Actinobacteria bacterium]|nr:arsenic transporter [Actinomycetota bacterium]
MPDLALPGSLVVLGAVLVAVVRSPGGRTEATWSVPAAALVVALGWVTPREAASTLGRLAPTLAFLAATFVLARLADGAGLFQLVAERLARAGRRGPEFLLGAVAVAAVAVTSVLSLDATAVLLTPVVVAATRGRADRDRSVLATVLLANGASLLLPIANLTNLLAFEQLDLGFTGFAARMALPTAVAATVITLGCRLLGGERPVADGAPAATGPAGGPHGFPVAADPTPSTADAGWVAGGLAVLLVAFAAAGAAGVEPAAVAVVGAVVLGAVGLVRRTVSPAEVGRALDPGFLAFVGALGIVVAAPAGLGLTHRVAERLPAGDGLAALLVVAFGAAVLANLVTNLPALLVLLPAIGPHRPALVLAALLGVNIGPNLTVTGSLATLLWRRVVRAEGAEPARHRFALVGWATTPVALAGATVALWATLPAR